MLEDGLLRRIGSVQECRVNVRLLTATNRNLAKDIEAGRFREDLYCRINVMSLELPLRRAREGDIALLIVHFRAPAGRSNLPPWTPCDVTPCLAMFVN